MKGIIGQGLKNMRTNIDKCDGKTILGIDSLGGDVWSTGRLSSLDSVQQLAQL